MTVYYDESVIIRKHAVVCLQARAIRSSPEDNSELGDWLGVPGGAGGAPRDPQTGRGGSVPERLDDRGAAGPHHSHSQQCWSVTAFSFVVDTFPWEIQVAFPKEVMEVLSRPLHGDACVFQCSPSLCVM